MKLLQPISVVGRVMITAFTDIASVSSAAHIQHLHASFIIDRERKFLLLDLNR